MGTVILTMTPSLSCTCFVVLDVDHPWRRFGGYSFFLDSMIVAEFGVVPLVLSKSLINHFVHRHLIVDSVGAGVFQGGLVVLKGGAGTLQGGRVC